MTAVQKMDAPGADVIPVTPMQMLQTAVQQGADLDKLEKLMELQERWEANEARKAFVAAKAAFRADAPKIDKNKAVGFGNTQYDHATLGHIEELLAPVLSANSLTYSWETDQTDSGEIVVSCVLTHVRGHSERVSLRGAPDASGSKNKIQQVGSTTTYLSRYTLLLALGLSTGDADDDGHGATAFIDAEQKATIVRQMNNLNVNTEAFLKHLGVDLLDELPAAHFNKAMQALAAKRKQASTPEAKS